MQGGVRAAPARTDKDSCCTFGFELASRFDSAARTTFADGGVATTWSHSSMFSVQLTSRRDSSVARCTVLSRALLEVAIVRAPRPLLCFFALPPLPTVKNEKNFPSRPLS